MWLLLLACAHKSPPPPEDLDSGPEDSGPEDSGDSGDSGAAPVLYVSAYWTGAVFRFDPATGAALGPIEGLPGAQSVALVDGLLYIAAEGDHAVRIADPATGLVTGTLIADDPTTEADETGGLDGPTAAVRGPDGLWYVASFNTDSVLRYDGSGAFLDVFVPPGTDGLDGPDIGMRFDLDGDLLVPGWYSDTVHAFAPDGTPLPPRITAEDGLSKARALYVGEDGRLWATSNGSDSVLVREPDGAVAKWAHLLGPAGLWLHAGELFVAQERNNKVRVFDAETGEDRGVRVEDAALDGATFVTVL